MFKFKTQSKLFILIICSFIVLTFVSCDNNQNTNKKSTLAQFTQEEDSIDSNYIIKNLTEKGFNPKKVASTNEPYNKIFSVPQERILINGGYLSIYQYKTTDKQLMINDFNSINDEGYLFTQNSGDWTRNFHLYKKGRVFVVYDGSDINILNSLNEILGSPQ